MMVTIDLGEHYSPLTLELEEGDSVISISIGGGERTGATIEEAKLIRANLDALIAQAEANSA